MPFDEYEARRWRSGYMYTPLWDCGKKGVKNAKNVDWPLFVFDLGKFVFVCVCYVRMLYIHIFRVRLLSSWARHHWWFNNHHFFLLLYCKLFQLKRDFHVNIFHSAAHIFLRSRFHFSSLAVYLSDVKKCLQQIIRLVSEWAVFALKLNKSQ